MISAGFKRSAKQHLHCHSHNIGSNEYWCTDGNGHGTVITTGDGSSANPPSQLLMALGACISHGITFYIEKRGKKIKSIDVDIHGEYSNKPSIHISDIKLDITAETDVDQETFSKIVKEADEKMCPVSGTLHYSPKITISAKVK